MEGFGDISSMMLCCCEWYHVLIHTTERPATTRSEHTQHATRTWPVFFKLRFLPDSAGCGQTLLTYELPAGLVVNSHPAPSPIQYGKEKE